ELNGRNPVRPYNYGKMLYVQDKYAAAADQFSKAIALNPGYMTAYAGRGDCYYLLGMGEKAIEDLSRVI
ncbi:MAG: tetratricopeptide repeat protein, partial [Bacteroidota bacterium]|nr:tetratricopeptide repeat protein [Bacteroidota bacterium]